MSIHSDTQFLQGIPASPGIAIGNAVILDRGRLSFDKYHIGREHIAKEQERLRSAFTQSIEELRVLLSRFEREGAEHQYILEAQILMLQDPLLVQGALNRIAEDRVNAEWALRMTSLHIREFFERIEEAYFRERTTDVESITDRVMTNLVQGELKSNHQNLENVHGLPILIAPLLSPAETVQWLSSGIVGTAVEGGSATSHTTIVARSLEVPAVMGVKGLTRIIGNGDRLIIDGDTGAVIIRPTDAQCTAYAHRRDADRAFHYQLRQNRAEPGQTADGQSIELLANIDLPEELSSIRECGGSGIGLLRTEFLFLGRSGLPTEDEQVRYYQRIIRETPNNVVTIRTLDIGGDKVGELDMTARELRPFVGLRAIRYCLREKSIFKTQLRAILRAAVDGDVRILIPFISTAEEIEEARSILQEMEAQLLSEKIPYKSSIPLGIMIELPAAALTVDTLSSHADFLSVGTNDLIQYLLAADREAEESNNYYQPLHPALIRLLANIAEEGRRANIPIGVCGEMAGVPLYSELLIGMGYRELSMTPRNIPAIKRIARNITQAESTALRDSALKCRTEKEMRTLLTERMKERFPDLFPSL